MIRNERREGLIRSRLAAARVATGRVLVFLDSHVEVTAGWLEPLVHEILESESTVVSPTVDIIDKDSFEYHYNEPTATLGVGGFDWNMHFGWHALPAKQQRARKSAHEPARTPVLTSGMFAIAKKYFEQIGAFDDGMVGSQEHSELISSLVDLHKKP